LPPIIFEKEFSNAYLLVSDKMETYVLWKLNDKALKSMGQKVAWFLCFKRGHYCNLDISRPHATCLTCKLRKVIALEIPYLNKVIVRQIWDNQPKSKVSQTIFKMVLSLAELCS
jgi:hypothetical protein